MQMKPKTLFGWIGAISGILAIIGGLYSAYTFLTAEEKLGEEFFLGRYVGTAEGAEFTLGIQSVGLGQVVGEVNFGEWSYVETQLKGSYDAGSDLIRLDYRRNEHHPRGPDEGIAIITYDKEKKAFLGYWSSKKFPGNEETWVLQRKSKDYSVRSWDG